MLLLFRWRPRCMHEEVIPCCRHVIDVDMDFDFMMKHMQYVQSKVFTSPK